MSSDSSSSFTRIVPMALGAVTLGGAAYYVTKLIAERDGGSSSDMKREMASRDEEIRSLRQQVKLLASQTEEVTVDGVSSPAQALEKRRQGKPVRLYMDGCFDMTHFGHANALRQAKSLGDVLVVGIHTDEEISRNKGSPLMNYEERVSMLGSLKWVDEIIRDAPYTPTEEWMNKLFTEYDIDYVVHGDDPALNSEGQDAYMIPKRMGRMKIVKRTEGVSTTDIVGRMLLHTRSHHIINRDDGAVDGRLRSLSDDLSDDGQRKAAVSQFLPTTRRLLQFSKGIAPKPQDRIVLVTGAFDLFHVGHADALRRAREFGDFLLVGVHDDETVNEHRGSFLPIMNLHERALSVLACRHVDEVIIGSPWEITRDLLVTMDVSVVVTGTHSDSRVIGVDEKVMEKRFGVAKEMGIFKEFESPRKLSSQDIMIRVMENKSQFEEKFNRKHKSEQSYLASKTYVKEK